MTAIVLPDIDRSTLEELKSKMPTLDLSEIELPRIEKMGRNADKAIDRLLGREKSPAWPWVAAGIGLVTLIGLGAALITWSRRTAWPTNDGNTGLGSSGYRAGAETGTDVSVTEIYGETTSGPITGDMGTTSGLGGTDESGLATGGTTGLYGSSTGEYGGDYGSGSSGSGLTAAESSLTSSLEGNQP
jgi:hypothetical protein